MPPTAGSRGPFMPSTHRHPIGVLRREFLQVGFSGLLGLGLPELLGIAGSRRGGQSGSA